MKYNESVLKDIFSEAFEVAVKNNGSHVASYVAASTPPNQAKIIKAIENFAKDVVKKNKDSFTSWQNRVTKGKNIETSTIAFDLDKFLSDHTFVYTATGYLIPEIDEKYLGEQLSEAQIYCIYLIFIAYVLTSQTLAVMQIPLIVNNLNDYVNTTNNGTLIKVNLRKTYPELAKNSIDTDIKVGVVDSYNNYYRTELQLFIEIYYSFRSLADMILEIWSDLDFTKAPNFSKFIPLSLENTAIMLGYSAITMSDVVWGGAYRTNDTQILQYAVKDLAHKMYKYTQTRGLK